MIVRTVPWDAPVGDGKHASGRELLPVGTPAELAHLAHPISQESRSNLLGI